MRPSERVLYFTANVHNDAVAAGCYAVETYGTAILCTRLQSASHVYELHLSG